MALTYPPAREHSPRRTPSRTLHKTVCDDCNVSNHTSLPADTGEAGVLQRML